MRIRRDKDDIVTNGKPGRQSTDAFPRHRDCIGENKVKALGLKKDIIVIRGQRRMIRDCLDSTFNRQ